MVIIIGFRASVFLERQGDMHINSLQKQKKVINKCCHPTAIKRTNLVIFSVFSSTGKGWYLPVSYV